MNLIKYELMKTCVKYYAATYNATGKSGKAKWAQNYLSHLHKYEVSYPVMIFSLLFIYEFIMSGRGIENFQYSFIAHDGFGCYANSPLSLKRK